MTCEKEIDINQAIHINRLRLKPNAMKQFSKVKQLLML